MNYLKAGNFLSKRKRIYLLLKVGESDKECLQIVYLDECGKVCQVYGEWADYFVHDSYVLFGQETQC